MTQRHLKLFGLVILPILVFDLHFPHMVWADTESFKITPFAKGEFVLVPKVQESIFINSNDRKIEIEIPIVSRPLTWKEREMIAVIPKSLKKQKAVTKIAKNNAKKIVKNSAPKQLKKKSIAKKVTPKAPIGDVVLTAYSSTIDQTDSSPCITATGFNVCKHNKENIIAANFLPFGTKVRIPELYGDKVFIVQDRMNKRYSSRVDIWMKTRGKAKQFGVKRAKIEVVHEELAMK